MSKIEFITTDSNIFKATNIYLLLHTLIKEDESGVIIYTYTPEIKEELTEKHTDTLLQYFNNKNIAYIFDPSQFSDIQGFSEDKDDPDKKPIKIKKQGVFKGSNIVKELAIEPFFVSKGINDTAYGYAENIIKSKRPTIFFLYGPSSTGKSHLVSRMAVALYEKGDNVYIANGDNFISELFSAFKNNIDFIDNHKNINCFIIDDIQTLNKHHLMSVLDYLFSIMTHTANTNGKLIVTCDQHPAALKMFPDRIITRLMSDYIAEVRLPDDNIKRQYIEHNFEKMELVFSSDKDREEIKKFIILNSPQLRVARGLLGLCDIIGSQDPPISFLNFISRVPRQVSTDASSGLWRLRELFINFFGEADKIGKAKSKESRKTRRKTMQTDSLCYYLLQNSVPLKTLQKDLNITRNHHTYYLERGKQIYESIEDEAIIMQIRLIMQK